MASRHLLNPLAPLNQPSPSSLDGVPEELERDLRAFGAILIQQAGVMLKAPQVVMATAQVLFQRFWCVTSLKHFGIRDIGLGALFLASKLEESPLRIRDLINTYSYLLSLIAHCSASPLPFPSPSSFTSYVPMDYFATEFYDRKDALVIAEMQILKRLGFQTQCGLPYGHLVNYLKVLELDSKEQVVSKCWGYLNDMLQTPAPALYPQSTLALASIYLVSRLSIPQIPLPLSPIPWWTLFDATEEDLINICTPLLKLYKDWGNSIEEASKGGNGGGGEICWKKFGKLPFEKSGVRERLIILVSKSVEGENGDSNGKIDGLVRKDGELIEEELIPEPFQIKGAF